MTRLNKLFLLFLTFFLFNFSTSYSNDKIVYLDIENLVKKTNIGMSILKELEEKNQANLIELKNKKEIIIANENEIKKTQNISSQNDINDKIKNLNNNINDFNNLKKDLDSNFNNLKNEKFNNFFNLINPIISEYMSQNSISIIFDKKNIFVGNNDYEITDNIIELINKKFN